MVKVSESFSFPNLRDSIWKRSVKSLGISFFKCQQIEQDNTKNTIE